MWKCRFNETQDLHIAYFFERRAEQWACLLPGVLCPADHSFYSSFIANIPRFIVSLEPILRELDCSTSLYPTSASLLSFALLAETNWEDGYHHGSFFTVFTEHFGHYFLYPVHLVSFSLGNFSSCYRDFWIRIWVEHLFLVWAWNFFTYVINFY